MLLSILSFPTYADDLKVADDFKEGDILSAETFNQIFDTLEEINRTVKEDDIFGTWNCSSIASGLNPPTSEVDGWLKKGFLWELSSSQVNFKAPIGMDGTTQSQSAENTVKYPRMSPLHLLALFCDKRLFERNIFCIQWNAFYKRSFRQ